MAHSLRDERVANISVNEDVIRQISELFAAQLSVVNRDISDNDKKALLTYIIRFDNKGYRVFHLEELLQHFQQAKEIERIIFLLETGDSLRTGRQIGVCMELRLDQKDSNNCLLIVTSDERAWVNSQFSTIQNVLDKFKNKNGWFRMAWMQLVAQLVGVTLLFIISLFLTVKAAPKLQIPTDNSFIICFLFFLLIFSNIWTYLNQKIIYLVNALFPNIKFYRPNKERFQWLKQGIIVSCISVVIIGILAAGFSFIKSILASFIAG